MAPLALIQNVAKTPCFDAMAYTLKYLTGTNLALLASCTRKNPTHQGHGRFVFERRAVPPSLKDHLCRSVAVRCDADTQYCQKYAWQQSTLGSRPTCHAGSMADRGSQHDHFHALLSGHLVCIIEIGKIDCRIKKF